MRQAVIRVHTSLDTTLFSQYALIDDTVISERIQPANLEVCWW